MHAPSDIASGSYAGTDLQLAVLRNLPTPVLALSSQRVIVFANRAAQKVLGDPDTTQPLEHELTGKTPAEVGIELLYNRVWNVVLDQFLCKEKLSSSQGEGSIDNLIHEVDAVVLRSHPKFEEKHFRILFSTVEGKDGYQFILSLEKSSHVEKMLIPRSEESTSAREGDSFFRPRGATDDSQTETPRDIACIKKAVFDSRNVPGFILSVDEKFYLTNTKTRELIGCIMGGAEGCDSLSLCNRLNIWDEKFTRRLEPSEFPWAKLVRAKEPFTNYRCGYTYFTTGEKVVMSVDGECLYDDDTGELIGGMCWCKDIQEYSDFLSEQQQRHIASHETTCNLMPHLVWTTTNQGYCDWFSERVGL